jgi:23S rRNA (cytidine1920-2'-O)/16S rRNA (cytidine1409-2'-O)-methyltransferase
MEERLDKILVQRNLVDTRVKAEKLIQEIGVKVYGKLVTKPGKKFPIDCKIDVISEDFPWVSIDSMKIVEAISKWNLKIENGNFLDVGILNGAFTEVLLKNNAKKVYALNPIKDSTISIYKGDERIVDFSGTYLRELTFNNVTDEIDGCVIDEPNLSMDKILPFIHPFLKTGGFVVAVIKPHLEVGKEHLKNNGAVRNTLGFPEMFESLKKIGETNNLKFIDEINSPIAGKDGQQEFMIIYRK